MHKGVGGNMGDAMNDHAPVGGSRVGPKIEKVDQASLSLLGFSFFFFFRLN